MAAISGQNPPGVPLVLLGKGPGHESEGRPTLTVEADAGADAVLDACNALASGRFQGHSVLLVEDDEDVPRLVRTLLEPFGIRLLPARDLLDCQQLVSDETPCVALVDARLPVWSGFEVCKHLRSDPRFAGTFILMLSASASPVDRLAAVEAGADDYLLKPIVGVELTARVLQRVREHEHARFYGALPARDSQPALDSSPRSLRDSHPPR